MDDAEVTILLATYNGAPYLDEQIQSLRAQSHSHWRLVVRDDGSSDETPAILRRWAERDPRIQFLVDGASRLGPARSFGRLLQGTLGAPYVMFCDQDDVWLSDKITLTLEAMRNAESSAGPETPIAVHTDLELVDATLKKIHPSAKRRMGFDPKGGAPFEKLLAQNFVTGCTLMINRSLTARALPIPDEAIMHDWWIALLAAASGRLIYVDRSTILYRQHGRNASGESKPQGLVAGAGKFAGNQGSFDELMRQRFRQMEACLMRLESQTPGDDARFLADYLQTLRRNRISGIIKGLRRGVRMQGFARTGAYYLLLLKRGYPG